MIARMRNVLRENNGDSQNLMEVFLQVIHRDWHRKLTLKDDISINAIVPRFQRLTDLSFFSTLSFSTPNI